MKSIYISTWLQGKHYQSIWDQFDNTLLEQANPPWVSAELLRYDGNQVGDEVHLVINLILVKQTWISVITHYQADEQGYEFIDEGKQLPFFLKSWRHRHVIRQEGNGTEIVDDIQFSTGTWLTNLLLYPALYAQFWYRKPVYKRYFQ